MNKFNTRPLALPANQQGAVLIVVLLFLVLITIVGVMSVRKSATDLKLSTSDQINTVLLQSADNVNSNFESAINVNTEYELDDDKRKLKEVLYSRMVEDITGPLGHYTSDDSGFKSNDIIEFCYRPRDQFYHTDRRVIRRNGGIASDSDMGYCNPSKRSDYGSERATTMTKVQIDNIGDTAYNNQPDFAHMNLKVDTGKQGASKKMFNIITTSSLPSYGDVPSSVIKNCYKTTDTQGCLIDVGVANNSVIERAEVYDLAESEYCKFYGNELNPRKSKNCNTK